MIAYKTFEEKKKRDAEIARSPTYMGPMLTG